MTAASPGLAQYNSKCRRLFQSVQTIDVLIRQMGHDFLQPVVDAMWTRLEGQGTPAKHRPTISVTVEPSR
jgi:hypothetical protein